MVTADDEPHRVDVRHRPPAHEDHQGRRQPSRRPGVFKLIESAQARWRAVNAPHPAALVRAGTRFERGVLVERADA